MKKIIFVIFLFFIIKLFVSCCNCSDDTTPMQLNDVAIRNLNSVGSSGYVNYNKTDTMLSAKVAFEVIISDSTIDYNKMYAKNNLDFGFSIVNAFGCDCFQIFKPEQKIIDIKIFNLFDMNELIPANSDVTSNFFALISQSNLYTSIKNLYPLINHDVISAVPKIGINIFCKLNIQNTKAKFRINIGLSNGKILTAYTNEIQLLTSANND